jgi:predicted enzyme related to lactoylglutathione lyase
MKTMKVNGLGGVFIKAKNPDQLYRWYEDNLGLQRDTQGRFLVPSERLLPDYTLVSFINDDKVPSSDASCTLNFQVDHLAPLLSNLAEAGVHIEDHLEETPNGRFAWIFDPEGNKIELWEPRSYESSVIDLPEPE